MAQVCKHGDMKFIEGVSKSNGKAYRGWFCKTPKGSLDQCAPIFERDAPESSGGYPRAYQAPKPLESRPVASGEVLQPILESILSEIKKINAKLEKTTEEEVLTSDLPF